MRWLVRAVWQAIWPLCLVILALDVLSIALQRADRVDLADYVGFATLLPLAGIAYRAVAVGGFGVAALTVLLVADFEGAVLLGLSLAGVPPLLGGAENAVWELIMLTLMGGAVVALPLALVGWLAHRLRQRSLRSRGDEYS